MHSNQKIICKINFFPLTELVQLGMKTSVIAILVCQLVCITTYIVDSRYLLLKIKPDQSNFDAKSTGNIIKFVSKVNYSS